MVYPLDQVSIRFYPETLVIASYLRVFFTECPPKSCLEYFGPFWRKNMVSQHSPKNYVFAVFNFVPLHYPKNFSTERGVLNNTLPANIIYKSELRLILQVIYVFRNQKHKSISQYRFGIFDVQIFGRCSGYDSAAEEHLAKCQSEIRLHRRTLYFSLHCSTVEYVVSRKRN